MRATGFAAAVLAAAAAFAGVRTDAAGAGEAEQKAPGPKTTGQVYGWKSADGLVYEYFVPRGYDPAKGAGLTLVLHGSNLDHRWGFANHKAGEFRKDDVVVCPDGTTANGKGGFNFLQNEKDLQRLKALQDELRKTFKVNATYVYGHSQGSFFSFLYAGAYPEDVQGVVGQASGVWIGTEATPKHHHQAIALMHGTADPVVPYVQSVGGLDFYREAKYPLTHLRSLQDWNHWPTEPQTELELAWCEGMTSADPARVAASFATLEPVEPGGGFDRDAAALYEVAKRIATVEGVPAEVKSRAAKTAAEVEDVAKRHVESIAASIAKGKGEKLEDAAWVGHLPTFLRDFDGVPPCDALAKEWADRLAKQKKDAQASLREFYRNRQKDPAKAFAAGVDAIRAGFLWCECTDGEFLKTLAGWKADAAKLKIGKADLKAYDDVVPVFVSARKKGLDAYASVNRKQ
jgi:pimeloyl-ACP methyl ester carboxylesterase